MAIRLHDLGYQCVGVDADESMLTVAVTTIAAGSRPDWVLADLSTLDLDQHGIPTEKDGYAVSVHRRTQGEDPG